MSVTGIHDKRKQELSSQFDELVEDAALVCLVTVRRDGGVGYMLPDRMDMDAALIGALEATKLVVTDRMLDDA